MLVQSVLLPKAGQRRAAYDLLIQRFDVSLFLRRGKERGRDH